MEGRLSLNVLSFIYVLLTVLVYYSKQRINSVENRIYRNLLKIMPIGIFLEFWCNMSALYFPDTLGSNILGRLYLVFIVNWVIIFSLYICSVTIMKGKTIDEYLKSNYRKIYLIVSLISSILLMVLPLNFILSGNESFIDGVGIIVLLTVIIIFILIDFVFTIIKFRKMKLRDKMPMLVLFLIMLLLIVIHSVAPQIQVISTAFGFLTVLMFFTIENPDVMLLEEATVAREQADKANHAKSDFLSSMSHEIRTPLNAIVGLSEDILEMEDLPPAAKEDADDIVMASQTLLEIVGNILDISKIESEKLEITESEYNPREIFENLARIDAVRIGEKPIDFKLHIAEDLPFELIGDKVHVKQVVNNLISNSIKYTNEGEINLTINCINKGSQCDLIITCQDTGIGIKKEYIDKLFGKFERLGVERNTTVEGTGLGLAITKKLVEMMGGKINVNSIYGKGTMFMVYLPQKISKLIDNNKVSVNTNGPFIIPAVKPGVDYSNKRILIVDDNALNIKVAKKALAALNPQTDECADGTTCIEKIKSGEKYDIILLDIMMPGLDGSKTLAELKNIEGFNTPVIALTADAIQGAQEKYLSEGFTDYIAKPFSKDQIKEKLDKIIN